MVTRVRQAALGQAVNEYLDILSAGGRARTTLELYRGLLRRFAQAVGEDRSVGELSTADATAHLAALRERSSSGAYPTTVTRVLKGFFTWLTETGQIEVNPMASITATCGLNASTRAHYTGSFAASGSGQGCQGPSLIASGIPSPCASWPRLATPWRCKPSSATRVS